MNADKKMKELEELETMAEAAFKAAVQSRGSWDACYLYEESEHAFDAYDAAAKNLNDQREKQNEY